VRVRRPLVVLQVMTVVVLGAGASYFSDAGE
jgi:hypothetical protein